jgi:hypothetical protein
MLRCLTIRRVVAQHTDDGGAQYSSVRQLFRASSEHDTLGTNPFLSGSFLSGAASQQPVKSQQAQKTRSNPSHPPCRHGAPKSSAHSWFAAVRASSGCPTRTQCFRFFRRMLRPASRYTRCTRLWFTASPARNSSTCNRRYPNRGFSRANSTRRVRNSSSQRVV